MGKRPTQKGEAPCRQHLSVRILAGVAAVLWAGDTYDKAQLPQNGTRREAVARILFK